MVLNPEQFNSLGHAAPNVEMPRVVARWNSLMELFMVGGNYAASEVRFPEGVPGFRAGGDCGSAVGRRTPARGAAARELYRR